jgi:hypothetical protein
MGDLKVADSSIKANTLKAISAQHYEQVRARLLDYFAPFHSHSFSCSPLFTAAAHGRSQLYPEAPESADDFRLLGNSSGDFLATHCLSVSPNRHARLIGA